MLAMKHIGQRLLATSRFAFSYLNHQGIREATKEFNENPPVKFHNKKFYNPEYHYHIEGPDVLRVYSERDNSAPAPDFTEVLDSVYYNVQIYRCRWSCLNISILSFTARFSTRSNLNGPSIILMRKGLFQLSSEENTL